MEIFSFFRKLHLLIVHRKSESYILIIFIKNNLKILLAIADWIFFICSEVVLFPYGRSASCRQFVAKIFS